MVGKSSKFQWGGYVDWIENGELDPEFAVKSPD
jgi:hypothetical protein